MLATVVDRDGLWLWEMVRDTSLGTPDGLSCQLSCVYFPSLIRDLVAESWLSIPACCQVPPTGKSVKSSKSLGFRRGVAPPEATLGMAAVTCQESPGEGEQQKAESGLLNPASPPQCAHVTDPSYVL